MHQYHEVVEWMQWSNIRWLVNIKCCIEYNYYLGGLEGEKWLDNLEVL